MVDLVSIDLGKNGGMATWEGTKCIKVISWEIGKKQLEIEHLVDILKYFKEAIVIYKPIVAVERPSRRLPHQWLLYCDLRSLADTYKCSFNAYFPQTIKKTTIGHGKATKEEMQEAVLKYKILEENVKPEGEHQWDSIGCGLTHLLKKGKISSLTENIIPVKKKMKSKGVKT